MDKLKELIKKILKEKSGKDVNEESSTGSGPSAATFTPGTGEQYTSKLAFNPNKKAQGTSRNYYLKMGWKLVNKNKVRKAAKGMEYKDLWK